MFCSCSYRLRCGPGDWVQIGSVNPLDKCPDGFMSENIGGAQVCWKKEAGCTSFFFGAGQDYTAVCGVAAGYAFGSPDAFSHIHSPNQTIDEAYVDGLSITYGNPRQHLFTYAVTVFENSCPCKGGPTGPAFIGSNFYCGENILAPGEQWESVWYTYPLWHATSGCSDYDVKCRNDFRPWFSVLTFNPTSNPIEIRSCHDYPYTDEALGINNMKIYIKVD